MKVQTKISLLLLAVLAIFLGGLAALRSYEKVKFGRVAEQRFEERNRSFDAFINSYGVPLQTMVDDMTCYNQLVRAIATRDEAWLKQNLSSATLGSFHANAVWVYSQQRELLYAQNNLYTPQPLSLPVPVSVFPRIFAEHPLRHFFVRLPQGLMEIRAGTVHPSEDFQRRSPAYGYLFAGRLWSKSVPSTGNGADSVIGEMALFTNSEIHLVPASASVEATAGDGASGPTVFARSLSAWNGRPLAQLVIRSDSPLIRELKHSSERLLLALVLFSLVLLLLLWLSLERWVRQPLQRIMRSLKEDDPKTLKRLRREGSEFGALAQTVHQFFIQRWNLLREMNERRATEAALHRREEELRHAQKLEAVGRLAGGVAHDFNNLLTAIIGYAELMAGRADNPVFVRQGSEMVRKAGGQAAALTRQLLAFSRKQILQPKVIDLNQLVVEMEQLLRRVIGERFELVTVAQAALSRVKADPGQLEQVILNLGVNARDAMPGGGRLTIRTDNATLDRAGAARISPSLGEGEYVVLSVSDTGDGMDEETKARIFEPFFTTKSPGKGTGLGLATVYGIVSQSGGGIDVESAQGRGSIFRIYLPLESAPLDGARPSPPPIEHPPETETVLVVEDEEIVRELVCEVLQQQGYTVLCSAHGEEALRMAHGHGGSIDLLLTDVIMPQMNGHELADQLQLHRPQMRVLYVSGYSDNDLGQQGILDADLDLLQKPFTPQALARKVRETLGSCAPTRQRAPAVP